mmetsp:Transcript_18643/g.38676  ORF Transcript_18643/g.38676 Transcript_18643/m.38676 type:complete len:294 (-) Transcript_18643:1647-2528(-)
MPDTDLLAESSLRIELGDAARAVGVASLLRRGLGDGRLREEARPVTAVELSPCCCESPFPGVENFPFGVSPSTLVGADAGRRSTALRGGIDLGGALLLVLLVPPDGEASSRTPVRTNLPMTPSSSHSASTSSLIFVNCFISLPAAANTLSAAPLILSQEIIAQYIFFSVLSNPRITICHCLLHCLRNLLCVFREATPIPHPHSRSQSQNTPSFSILVYLLGNDIVAEIGNGSRISRRPSYSCQTEHTVHTLRRHESCSRTTQFQYGGSTAIYEMLYCHSQRTIFSNIFSIFVR